MMVQLTMGAALIILSTLVAVAGFVGLETAMIRYRSWLLRPPHAAKMMALLCLSVIWFLVIVTVAVWMWAGLFLWLGIFATVEAAVYFALVSFTTLGFGDILLPMQWRLLSGMAAINGLLMIGLQTAMLIEVMRRTRSVQRRRHDRGDEGTE